MPVLKLSTDNQSGVHFANAVPEICNKYNEVKNFFNFENFQKKKFNSIKKLNHSIRKPSIVNP